MRSRVEVVLRAIALGVLAWSLVAVLADRGSRIQESGTSDGLRARLVRWSTTTTPGWVNVELTALPASSDRDWLADVRRAGTNVDWSGQIAVPAAIAAEPLADPTGATQVRVTAPRGTMAVLGDDRGPIDSARLRDATVAFTLGASPGRVTARVGPIVASTAARDTLTLGALLVLGGAGWEAKFVMMALEERGWKVDAHFALSPKSDIQQGRIATIDTSRYAAVIALDTTADRYGDRIRAYVSQGGGLVLWAAAARAPSLAPLAPTAGVDTIALPADELSAADSAPRDKLALIPLTGLRADAVPIERRASDVTIAARRVGIGRVIEIGYQDSWRWRLHGAADAPAAHRAWLAAQVASVAYARAAATARPRTDDAPFATLVDRLGPPTPRALRLGQRLWVTDWRFVFTVLCVALMLEWISRRMRGAR